MAQPVEPSPPGAATRVTLRTVPLRRDWHDARRGVALGCVLVGVSWLLLAVTHRGVAGWERGVFHAVNDLPDPLRRLLWLPMQLGSSWAWMLALPALVIVYRRLAPGLAVALGGWSAYLVTQGAKALADRPRPAALLAGVHVRTLGASGNGYPSGHAAVAAGIIAALVPWVGRRTRTALWLLAGTVAFARIYFGVHLPLDVVGGAGIGLIFGTIATVLVGVPERTGAR